MSRTFPHKGRRVDFDLWMFPDLNFSDDFDLLASLVTGKHTPPVGFVIEKASNALDAFTPDSFLDDDLNQFQFAVGAAMSFVGTAMLIPGPIDLALFTFGVTTTAMYGPIGLLGFIPLILYNLAALGLITFGGYLMATA